jgi:hypothetical protein
MITISADTNSTITATNADHWMIDTGVTVDTAGVGIDASGAVAGREFTIKGLLRSASGPAMQVGDASLADSQTKLRLDYTATVSSSGVGIAAASGGIRLEVVGDALNGSARIATTGNAVELRQGLNVVLNDGVIESTGGSAIFSSGAGDQLKNSATISAKSTAIVSEGSDFSFETYGNNNIVSAEGYGLLSTGANLTFKNSGGSITSRLDAISASGDNAAIENYATIASTAGAGIMATGAGTHIVNTVLVSGATAGIAATAAGADIDNYGEILSEGVGIQALGDGSNIDTTAKVLANVGLVVGGVDSVATNFNVIRSTSKTEAAVVLSETADFRHMSGTVSAKSGLAILAGSGDNAVDIRGLLRGDVKLGGGNDWFGSAFGEVKGTVYGGAGDDIYETGIPLDIVERRGQGNDTVKSAYTWTLAANIENLELVGKEIADAIGNNLGNVLTGSAADNKFWGKSGRDIFVMQTGGSHDTIVDFQDGRDLIDFRNVDGIDRFSDLKRFLHQSGQDVSIDLARRPADMGLTILNVDHNDLSASDFLF